MQGQAMRAESITTPTDGSARLEVLVQTTYDAIKTAILGNRLRPGAKLTHRVLAETFGVSRTPVRESLERLYQEGYVTRIANRGYYVAEIEHGEVIELYQTREALEVFALDLILKRGLNSRNGAAIAEIETINRRYGVLCRQELLSRERLQVDREFHLALARWAGNVFLCRSLNAIFDRLMLKRRVEGFHGRHGSEPHADHLKLLAAIVAGDKRGARQVLRAHIQGASTRFVSYLAADTE